MLRTAPGRDPPGTASSAAPEPSSDVAGDYEDARQRVSRLPSCRPPPRPGAQQDAARRHGGHGADDPSTEVAKTRKNAVILTEAPRHTVFSRTNACAPTEESSSGPGASRAEAGVTDASVRPACRSFGRRQALEGGRGYPASPFPQDDSRLPDPICADAVAEPAPEERCRLRYGRRREGDRAAFIHTRWELCVKHAFSGKD